MKEERVTNYIGGIHFTANIACDPILYCGKVAAPQSSRILINYADVSSYFEKRIKKMNRKSVKNNYCVAMHHHHHVNR